MNESIVPQHHLETIGSIINNDEQWNLFQRIQIVSIGIRSVDGKCGIEVQNCLEQEAGLGNIFLNKTITRHTD